MSDYSGTTSNKPIIYLGRVVIETCTWSLSRNYDDTMYETECQETFIFLDGNPYANNFRFCPYCGKEIVTDDADEIETDYYTSEDPDGAPEI